MAGGGGAEGLSTTILETPTYVLAIVALFFLILTLAFEHGIHALQRTFRNRGREGLVIAVDKAVLELTLLGLVSLILMLFQDYLPGICVPYSPGQVDWTLLNNLDDCPCCMAHSTGISTCAMMAHSCAFNTTTKEPYCGCNLGWPESTYDPTVIPDANEYCSAYENNEEEFIFNNFLGALISEINPTEFCNAVANGSITINTQAAVPAGGGTSDGGGGLRRSLLAAAAEAAVSSNDTEEGDDGVHVVPDVATFRCEGEFYASDCPVGSHPAISYAALHQIHLLIFLVAAIHVITSVCVVILAGMRIRQWRRWQSQDIELGPHHLIHRTETSGGDGGGGGSNGGGADGGGGGDFSNREGSSGGAAARRYEALLSNLESNPTISTELSLKTNPEDINNNNDITAPTATGASDTRNAKHVENNAEENTTTTTTASAPESVVAGTGVFVSEVQDAAKKAQLSFGRHWMRRKSRLLRKRHLLAEGAICLGQALLPNLVSQYEFSTMRVAYVGSHGLPETYDWVEELMIHLDFDLTKIIGASIVTWLIFILEWLFSGLVGWVSSVFMLIACLCVLAINIWLVVAIRFCCRGGRPHRIRNVSRWYNNPAWLCYPISGIIFLCSTSFSTALFFLWQFGADSCFFAQNQDMWTWLPGNLPWYAGLIGPGVLLIWMAYVTVPAWALVMHMRPKAIIVEKGDKGGASSVVDVEKAPELQQQGSRERRTQTIVMAEIQKLQTELMELQAPT